MEKQYSRRERRDLARRLGLSGNSNNFAKWRENVERSIKAGKQIDQQFKNYVENNLRNKRALKEEIIIKGLTESVGEERAKAIVANNLSLQIAREEKIAARRKRQMA